MPLSYQEVPLNGIILLTGDAFSPQKDLQLAEKKKKEREWEYSSPESPVK